MPVNKHRLINSGSIGANLKRLIVSLVSRIDYHPPAILPGLQDVDSSLAKTFRQR
jgi:hypothetical protein